MSKPLFSRKIKCAHCGSNFKSKKERKRRVYICSKYDNYGKEYCQRNVIDENLIVELLEKRYDEIENEEYVNLTLEEKVDKVEEIYVKGKMEFKIYLKDGIPIEFSDNFIQY